jgi:hypothetical protein
MYNKRNNAPVYYSHAFGMPRLLYLFQVVLQSGQFEGVIQFR